MMKNAISVQDKNSGSKVEASGTGMAEPGPDLSHETNNSRQGKEFVSLDTTMTQLVKRKRDRHWLQWLDYDADIIDNVSKTRRFMSESVSDDIVSKMSFSEERQEKDTGMLSPSPLSRREVAKEKIYRVETSFEEEDFVTPRKSGAQGRRGGPPYGNAGLMPSPSDMKVDDQDLRKVALVRLALRNIEDMKEDNSAME